MGKNLALNLADHGYRVAGFDLDKEKVAELVAKGGVAASSAAEAASKADFVIFSLNSAKVVRIAAFGEGGAASGANVGRAFTPTGLRA